MVIIRFWFLVVIPLCRSKKRTQKPHETEATTIPRWQMVRIGEMINLVDQYILSVIQNYYFILPLVLRFQLLQIMEFDKENIPQKIEDKTQKIINDNYDRLGKVRVTFRTEGVGIANSSKFQFFFDAKQKVLDFKLKMQEITKQNLYFYLNQSFMPSLDSHLGDLGQCYGRYDQKNGYYDLQFIVNGNQNRYG